MARGRPRKWTVTHPLAPTVKRYPDQWEKDFTDYLTWCSVHKLLAGTAAIGAYAASQRDAGLDPVAIANRVETFRGVTAKNCQSILQQHRLSRYISEIRKDKANQGGPARKPLTAIDTLMSWCHPTPANQRDFNYQVVWYFMIASGIRPEEHHTVKYTFSTTELRVQFNGRKNCKVSGAHYVSFSLELSCLPPPAIRDFLKKGNPIPHIGTRKNCASCINSWLRSFRTRYSLPKLDLHVTSTCPRVRMDNILREKLDSHLLAEHVYTNMIGHTTAVSDASYRR